MATATYIVKIDGDPKVILQSYSDSPLFKDGLRIASFVVSSSASPQYKQNNPDYGNGDTVVIQLDGATKVYYAVCKKVDATATIALARGTSTKPSGITLNTGAITTAVNLEFLIIYSVE